MKKKIILFILCVVIFIILFFTIDIFVPFDGYCYDLNEARFSEEIYKDHSNLFSVQFDDEIFDFIINQNSFYITRIDCKESYGRRKYSVRNVTTYLLDELVDNVDSISSLNDAEWFYAPALGNKKRIVWCILEKSFGSTQDIDFFEFEYNGIGYYLCYQRIE